jgi:hypothetical protein
VLHIACRGRSAGQDVRESSLGGAANPSRPSRGTFDTLVRRATSLPHLPVAKQVPEADLPAFNKFLTQLHYPYFRECDNPAYKRFLAAS